MTENSTVTSVTLESPQDGGEVVGDWAIVAHPKYHQAVCLFMGDGSGPITVDDRIAAPDLFDYVGSDLARVVFAARLRWIADALEGEVAR